MIIQRIQKSSNLVINIEEWESIPANTDSFDFMSQSGAGIGWKLENGQLVSLDVPPPITLDEYKEIKLKKIRDLRYEKEVGGITASGIPIRTDEKSQSKLQGAIALFNLNPNLASIEWEAVPGTFTTLTKENLVGIGIAVGSHIQSCFSKSRQLTEAVQACTTKAQVDAIDINSGWPGV